MGKNNNYPGNEEHTSKVATIPYRQTFSGEKNFKKVDDKSQKPEEQKVNIKTFPDRHGCQHNIHRRSKIAVYLVQKNFFFMLKPPDHSETGNKSHNGQDKTDRGKNCIHKTNLKNLVQNVFF